MKKVTTIFAITFLFLFEKKKTTAMSCRLLLWFCYNKKGDDTKLSLSSSVVVLKIRKR
jgi:hypothetical protein